MSQTVGLIRFYGNTHNILMQKQKAIVLNLFEVFRITKYTSFPRDKQIPNCPIKYNFIDGLFNALGYPSGLVRHSRISDSGPMSDSLRHSRISDSGPKSGSVRHSRISDSSLMSGSLRHSRISDSVPMSGSVRHSRISDSGTMSGSVRHSRISYSGPLSDSVLHSCTSISGSMSGSNYTLKDTNYKTTWCHNPQVHNLYIEDF
jgi:hypothetical protein